MQDFFVRYQLQSVAGVAEVASVGGFVRQYQIEVSPTKLRQAGVTLSQVMDAGWASFVLSHWVRERGLYSLEEGVRRLTAAPAAVLGLADRGVLAPGLRADFSLFAINRPADLCYWLGANPCLGRAIAGEPA